VHSSIVKFLETPALFTKMSIWNFPVLGWEKWFFAVVMMWVGPVGTPMSAWITRLVVPCSEVSLVERSLQAVVEESEV